MPLYLCRWPNGDVSIVTARSKDDAIVRLDEFENAESAEIWRLPDLLVDFGLNDEGRLQLNTFGETTEKEIMDRAFPDLEATLTSDDLLALDERSDEYRERVRQAVERERQRIVGHQRKRVRRPRTELGRRIQKETGAATALVDLWVDELGEKILDKTDDDTLH